MPGMSWTAGRWGLALARAASMAVRDLLRRSASTDGGGGAGGASGPGTARYALGTEKLGSTGLTGPALPRAPTVLGADGTDFSLNGGADPIIAPVGALTRTVALRRCWTSSTQVA